MIPSHAQRHTSNGQPAWYALYTKPHAERQVSQALEVRGMETYLPMMPVWRARRRRMEEEPVFACYSFVRADLSKIGMSDLSWLPGLRSVVNFDGEPTPLPDHVVDYIRQHVQSLSGAPQNVLQRGDRVRIIEGPLAELSAVFEGHLSGYERAQVLVQVLGRLTRCDIKTSSLEKY